MPESTVRQLAQFEDIVISDTGATAPSALPEVPVSMDTAVQIALADIGRSKVPGAGAWAALATVTTNSFGQELEGDPSKPSRVDPALDAELAWAVTFTEVPVQVDQSRANAESKEPSLLIATTATVVIFVSPATGQVILGTSF